MGIIKLGTFFGLPQPGLDVAEPAAIALGMVQKPEIHITIAPHYLSSPAIQEAIDSRAWSVNLSGLFYLVTRKYEGKALHYPAHTRWAIIRGCEVKGIDLFCVEHGIPCPRFSHVTMWTGSDIESQRSAGIHVTGLDDPLVCLVPLKTGG